MGYHEYRGFINNTPEGFNALDSVRVDPDEMRQYGLDPTSEADRATCLHETGKVPHMQIDAPYAYSQDSLEFGAPAAAPKTKQVYDCLCFISSCTVK